ncbi:MAG: glycosyltransferase [Terrimicrobiaceae bacterium]
MSSARKLFLVDQCLSGLNGHHLFYNRVLAEAATEAGFQTTVLARRDFLPEQISPFAARAVFRVDWRASPPVWMVKSRLMLDALDRLSFQRFMGDLKSAFRKTRWGPRDLVFGQMITPRHLAAWLEWMSACPSDQAPMLAVHVAYDPSRFGVHPILKRALKIFEASPHRDRLLPLTDSSRLSVPYEELLGRKVFVLPHVINKSISELNPFPADLPPVFGVLGSPRADKGFPEAVQAILENSTAPSPPRFLVVTSQPDASSAPWVKRLREARLANVELVDEVFDNDEDYARLFEKVSVLVLPYRLNVYGVRTSGIFCEALASGRSVIVSEGSWMSDYAGNSAACRRVPEKNPAALAAVIRDISLESREIAIQARKTAPQYREEFSSRAFVTGLAQAMEANV